MCLERWIRLIAGTFVLASLALGWFVSPYFLLFTAFVGVNLFQSALTRWCLMEDILKALGVEPCAALSEHGAATGASKAV
ncbi:MAG: DUF2892 domain-containing protein [Armatimonadota bacterium]|jgi:hypothetical protein